MPSIDACFTLTSRHLAIGTRLARSHDMVGELSESGARAHGVAGHASDRRRWVRGVQTASWSINGAIQIT